MDKTEQHDKLQLEKPAAEASSQLIQFADGYIEVMASGVVGFGSGKHPSSRNQETGLSYERPKGYKAHTN